MISSPNDMLELDSSIREMFNWARHAVDMIDEGDCPELVDAKRKIEKILAREKEINACVEKQADAAWEELDILADKADAFSN